MSRCLFDVAARHLGAQTTVQHVAELRTRVFVERRQDVGEHLRFNLAGYRRRSRGRSRGDRRAGHHGGRHRAAGGPVRGAPCGTVRPPRRLRRASSGADSTSFSRPTSSIRSISRDSCSRDAARRGCPSALVRGRVFLPGSIDARGGGRPGLSREHVRSARRGDVAVQPGAGRRARTRSSRLTSWANVQGGGRVDVDGRAGRLGGLRVPRLPNVSDQ